jgi:hypothetical protein
MDYIHLHELQHTVPHTQVRWHGLSWWSMQTYGVAAVAAEAAVAMEAVAREAATAIGVTCTVHVLYAMPSFASLLWPGCAWPRICGCRHLHVAGTWVGPAVSDERALHAPPPHTSGARTCIIAGVSHAPSAPPVHAAVRELFGETADCKYIHTFAYCVSL